MLNEDHKSIFTKWLGEHSSSVVKVARAYTLTRDECQDLAQEILLQAWRSMPKFEGKASPATWFYRVALHTAMNWHRKDRPRRMHQNPLIEVRTLAVESADSALLWIAGFMLLDRRRHPQRSSDPGEPLLFYVKESLAQVEHQIWLLRNVFWWYLLPPSISLMAFFTHGSWESTKSWWGCILLSGYFGVVLLIVYGGIYWLNQLSVRNQLEPRRSDLRKLIANLEGEGNGDDSGEMKKVCS